MPTENERKDVQKAMAYDLLRIFEQTPDKVYTPKEIKDLQAYRLNNIMN